MSKSRREKFLEFARNSTNVNRILVIRNGLIGDTVFVTPVLKRLRDNFTNARLDFATSAKSLPLLKYYPLVNAIYSIPGRFSVVEHSKFFFSLRKFHYDIVVVQEVNPHYILMAKLVKGKFLIGFKNSFEFLSDFSVNRPIGVHAVLAETETVRQWTNSISPVATELPITAEELTESRNLLLGNGVKILI